MLYGLEMIIIFDLTLITIQYRTGVNVNSEKKK